VQGWYAAQFEREMGCTEAELKRWLPGALCGRSVLVSGSSAEIAVDAGTLGLQWRALEPRRIALLRMPRLAVSFRFDGVDETTRQQVMRQFDLYTHRGGG
jgi:hypothetical protein